MDLKNSAISGLLGTFAAVVLFWLMDMNYCGWLGAWLTPGAAWIVGILMAAALGIAFAALWTGWVSKQKVTKSAPVVAAATVYGLLVGAIFIFLVPLLLSTLAGDPGMMHGTGTGFDSIGEAFGGHVVPELPDLGFDPPLHSMADNDWIHRDDFVARLLPFSLAFALYGAVLGLTAGTRK